MGEPEIETKVIEIDPRQFRVEELHEAANALREGRLVAFPTETVYGLGADAHNANAVNGIFAAKGRPGDNPLIVHVASPKELEGLVQGIPEIAARLIDLFWPGPLTLVLPKSPGVLDQVTAGLATVAVRMPAHPIALALIRAAGVPVAAPSANPSGKPSPTSGQHVRADLTGRVDIIIDGGQADVGLESTVLDLTGVQPVLLRPGGLTVEELQEAIGPVRIDPHVQALRPVGGRVRSPGMKYTHYAPEALVTVIEGEPAAIRAEIARRVHSEQQAGKRVGVMTTHDAHGSFEADEVKTVGERANLAIYAANLFDCLRDFDRAGVDVVLAEGVPEDGLGLAVMNRLRKAAGYRIVRVE